MVTSTTETKEFVCFTQRPSAFRLRELHSPHLSYDNCRAMRRCFSQLRPREVTVFYSGNEIQLSAEQLGCSVSRYLILN